MAKYVIEIPYEVKWIQYIQQTGHGTVNLKVESVSDLTPYTEPDEDEIRQKAREEVWDFVRGLIHYNNGFGMDEDELRSCFGYELYSRVFKNLTYSEAKAKYESWEKQKAEVRVGDEIVICNETAVVLWLNEYGNVGGYVCSDGKAYINGTGITSFTKTGRHFSEVAELLKKMKENENEIHS